MNIKSENILLRFIAIAPIALVLILSFSITQLLIHQTEKVYTQQSKEIEEKYLQENMKKVKNEVFSIIRFLENKKIDSRQLLKKDLKKFITQANRTAHNLYLKYKDTKTKDEIIKMVAESFRTIRLFNGRGYFFLYDSEGVNLLEPILTHLENKNQYNRLPMLERYMKKLIKEKEIYTTVKWNKPNIKSEKFEKIIYAQFVEPLGIAIGLGEYLVDFENELKEKVLININNVKSKNNTFFVLNEKGEYLDIYSKENRIINAAKNSSDIINTSSKEDGTFIKNKDSIFFAQSFTDWNWIIVSEFKLERLNSLISQKKQSLNDLRNEAITELIYISILLTFFFSLVSIYISNILKKMLVSYKKEVHSYIEKTVEKDRLLIQQSKMAIMGEMIGNITHQWKQPLSIISVSNELVRLNQEENFTSSKEDLHQALEGIDNSVKYLSNTIDDFRNFFKPDKQKQYFLLDHVFNKTFKLIHSQLKSENITLVKDIEKVEVFGYQNELLQVLINLIKNAKDELITLEPSAERLIFFTVYKEGDVAFLKIKDNANGVPQKVIDKIFDAYFSTKEDNEGTGIGLYMSKQIIEGMGGSIEVANTQYIYKDKTYNGAEFKIKLPLASDT